MLAAGIAAWTIDGAARVRYVCSAFLVVFFFYRNGFVRILKTKTCTLHSAALYRCGQGVMPRDDPLRHESTHTDTTTPATVWVQRIRQHMPGNTHTTNHCALQEDFKIYRFPRMWFTRDGDTSFLYRVIDRHPLLPKMVRAIIR